MKRGISKIAMSETPRYTQIQNIFQAQFEEGQHVTLKGWVYNKRSSGKVKFLLIRDGSAIIQGILFKGTTPEETMEKFAELHQESSLELSGTINKAPKAEGGWEVQVQTINIISHAPEYPITPKEHGPAFLQDHRHLWIRSKKQNAILRIRSQIMSSTRNFFDSKGFTGFDAPIFTPNACEGTTDLFEVEYFEDKKAYLSQSGQLYAEAGAMALGRCYTMGPTFRAEKSKTRRHLTEFWMVEPEAAFMSLEEDMMLAEAYLSFLAQEVIEKRSYELGVLGRDVSALEKISGPFPRMSYDEACDILEKESKDGFKRGSDFGGGDETILAEKFDKPLIIHRFPKNIKAFYMKEDPEDPTKCLSFDVIAPEGYGEIIGGSERETSLELLQQKIKEHDLPESSFSWYLDLRRFGSVPHSGFGLGIERFTSWICGVSHVRECIPFPRMLYRLNP